MGRCASGGSDDIQCACCPNDFIHELCKTSSASDVRCANDICCASYDLRCASGGSDDIQCACCPNDIQCTSCKCHSAHWWQRVDCGGRQRLGTDGVLSGIGNVPIERESGIRINE